MKSEHVTRFLCAFALIAFRTFAADLPWEFRDRQCEHPFRRTEHGLADLRPLFTWIRAGGAARHGSGPNPIPAWGGFMNYQVIYQSPNEYILLQRATLDISHEKIIDRDPEIVVLKNYPHEIRDGATISFIATDAGLMTVPDRFGIPHKHQAYDYGKPLSHDEIKLHLATARTNSPPRLNPQPSVPSPSGPKPKLQITLSGQ